MNNDSSYPEQSKTKGLDLVQVSEYTAKIQQFHSDEIKSLAIANGTNITSEDRMSSFEDAYLANLKKIMLAKLFSAEQYVTYEIEKQCCCDYESLEIPEWSEYIGDE